MPIIGLTDQESRAKRSLPIPVLAMVKKGAEKPERGVGKNLDHFRFEWQDLTAKAVFESIFGSEAELSEIPIALIGNDVDAVLDSSYRKYLGNNTLERKCDGCTILSALDNGLKGKPCICDPAIRDGDDPKAASKFCQPKGYFRFTIASVVQKLGYAGQFILLTGSVIEMGDMATLLQAVLDSTGRLFAQPFLLRRVERHFDKTINGKPTRLSQYMVELVPPIASIISPSETAELVAPPHLALGAGENLPDTGQEVLEGEVVEEVQEEKGEATPHPEWLGRVLALTAPLYKNDFHHRNSIKGLLENQVINTMMRPDIAAVYVLRHRIDKDYGLSDEELEQLFEGKIGEFIKKHETVGLGISAAWQHVQVNIFPE